MTGAGHSLASRPGVGGQPVRTAVHAADPLTGAGLTTVLGSRAGITVVPLGRTGVDVLVVTAWQFGTATVSRLRRLAAEVGAPTVLISDELTGAEVATMVECRVVAVLPRAAATGERLARTVTAAAAGDAVLPVALVGDLLTYAGHLLNQPLATAAGPAGQAGLSSREIEVLRLVAEGLDTGEIGAALHFSARTVKKVVCALTRRLGLRNRSHAVAYAIRAGIL